MKVHLLEFFTNHLLKMATLPNLINADLARGFIVAQVVEKHGWRLSMRTDGIFRILRQWLKHTRAASSSTIILIF
jgi:hypothetical protein